MKPNRLTPDQVGTVVKAIISKKLLITEVETKGFYCYIKAGGYDLEVKMDAPQDVCSCVTPSGAGYSRTLDEGSVRESVLPWMWAEFTGIIKLRQRDEPKVLALAPEPPLSTEPQEWEVVPMWHVKPKGEPLKVHHVSYEYFSSEEEARKRTESLTKTNADYRESLKPKSKSKKK